MGSPGEARGDTEDEDVGDEDVGALLATMDPETAAAPQAMYKSLREQSPVLRFGAAVGVSRRADIDEVFRHPEVFSSNMSAVDLGNVRPLIPLQIDPPSHIRYRRILDPLFAPRQVALLEPQVATLVHRLVDSFADRGQCDLAAELTVPLPSEVFLVLLGLPLSELATLLRIKDSIIRPTGATMDAQMDVRRRTALEIYGYFDDKLDERQANPRDDLLSTFLVTELDGERLTRHEILDICFLFLIAGLDTVSASLECFFAHLATHEDDRRRIASDPGVIPNAVEELLRWESPVAGVARVAVADAQIGGCPVHAGDQVFLMVGSANTDEAEFPDAEVVDFDRQANRHIAFGGGVHRCLGSHLARLELRVALREFHRRIPDYRLAPGTALRYTPGIRSIDHLPIIFPTTT